MHPKQFENILKLSSKERYKYFIKKIADFELVYLIQENDEYVSLESDEGEIIIPVYPELEVAINCLTDDWEKCSVEEMKLDDFLDWLDELDERGIRLCGFPDPDGNGIVINSSEMKSHIIFELDQYE